MRLVAITPGDGRMLDPWLLSIGRYVDSIVIREPDARAGEVRRWVSQIRSTGARAIVHQRTVSVPADGVHVPDGETATGWFGVSCHDAAGLDQAFANGAAWAFLSPVWPTSSHPDADAMGLDAFCELAAFRPVLALGGIDVERARLVRKHGFGVAVKGALFDQASPAEAAAVARALNRGS